MMFFNHNLIQLTFSSSLTEGNKRLFEQLGLYPRAGVDAWESHSLSVSQKALAGLMWADEEYRDRHALLPSETGWRLQMVVLKYQAGVSVMANNDGTLLTVDKSKQFTLGD